MGKDHLREAIGTETENWAGWDVQHLLKFPKCELTPESDCQWAAWGGEWGP